MKEMDMKESTLEKFEPAYREAYELVRNGNPAIKMAFARACFERSTLVIRPKEAARLIEEVAAAGRPPAQVSRWLLAETPYRPSLSAEEAADQGNGEARCMEAIWAFCRQEIDASDLQAELNANSCLVAQQATLLLDQLSADAREMWELFRLWTAPAARLARKDKASREKLASMHARIRAIEADREKLARTADSLSASALMRECNSLRDELATARKRLADAEARVADADRLSESKVAVAVEETKKRLEQAAFDRDFAAEERDEANGRADKSERKARAYEIFIRRHGLEPTLAFVDADGRSVTDAHEASHAEVTVDG
jgi:hypothetical protein